jgi:hypothetical protein
MLAAAGAGAATVLSGNVSGTWTTNGSRYILNAACTVASNQTLEQIPDALPNKMTLRKQRRKIFISWNLFNRSVVELSRSFVIAEIFENLPVKEFPPGLKVFTNCFRIQSFMRSEFKNH